MKRIATLFTLILLSAYFVHCLGQSISKPGMEARIDSVLSLMTLKEKIGQLNLYSAGTEFTGPGEKTGRTKERYERFVGGEVGSVLNMLGAKNTYDLQKLVVEKSRLGIPLLFAYDVIHGYKTMFPIPLAESASWDLDLMQRTAAAAARESAASGLTWTFAPMIDVSRDARWGRVMEGGGEDTYLGSLIAKARVKGFQGQSLDDVYTIAACAKHFAGYGFVESGMDYNTVDITHHTLYNYVLPPFQAAVEEAGVATVMNAFNEIGGIPSTANEHLQRDLLKGAWDFDGMVVSDWNSLGELLVHGVAADTADAAKLAMTAGSDMDMEGEVYIRGLADAIEQGHVKMKHLDDAVKRILRVKFALGLFDDPYRYSDEEREKNNVNTQAHRDLAREAGRKSVVLLKNDKNLLPLAKSGKIALIGPLAADKDTPLANWRAQAEGGSAVSLQEGLEAALKGKAEVVYAEGCKLSVGYNDFGNKLTIEEEDRSGFAAAISAAKSADVVVMALGESAYMSGEARSRAFVGMPGLQLELLQKIYQVNQNIVLVLMNGRPMSIPWEAENIPAILEAWHLGTEAGHALADVLLGDYNPAGKLTVSFPRISGQVPYYNQKMSGRPTSTPPHMVFFVHHMDVDRSALFPFGYGLSYTTFEYGTIQLDKSSMKAGEKIQVSIELKNTGSREGEEVVQLYIRDRVAQVTRPIKELKGFQKVSLKAGESNTIRFELSEEDLKYYNHKLEYKADPGQFDVMLGGNSRDLKTAQFELVK